MAFKINFLIPAPTVEGGSRVVARHAKYLADQGHDVEIIGRGRMPYPLKLRLQYLKKGKLKFKSEIDTSLFEIQGLKVKTWDGAARLTEHHVSDADITIATWWETVEWLSCLPESKGVKAHLIQDHEATFPFVKYEQAAAVHRLPTKKIVVSQWLRQTMLDEFGAKDCVLVENAVDAAQFTFQPRGKQNAPTVGFLCSMADRKNIARAIGACSLLRDRLPDLRAVAFGSHKPGPETGFPGWIDFHLKPAQNALSALYASCDVWLFTSDYEGFGLPILEAMACGTPVVATRAGAAPELVSDDVGALAGFSAESVADCALAILGAEDAVWRKMSEAARERATAYTWDDAGALFEKAILEFVAQSGRRQTTPDESHSPIAER